MISLKIIQVFFCFSSLLQLHTFPYPRTPPGICVYSIAPICFHARCLKEKFLSCLYECLYCLPITKHLPLIYPWRMVYGREATIETLLE